jgi:hypothetical protein
MENPPTFSRKRRLLTFAQQPAIFDLFNPLLTNRVLETAEPLVKQSLWKLTFLKIPDSHPLRTWESLYILLRGDLRPGLFPLHSSCPAKVR